MKKKFTTACFTGLIFFALNSWSFLDPYQVYKPYRLDIAIDTQFYKTTANFDSNGEKVNLPFDNTFQIIDVNPQLRWGITQDLGLRLGGNIGSSESVDPTNTRTNSTFNRVDVGADYLLLDFDSFQTILDFEYSHAIEKVEATTDSALNSNGANEVKPTVLLRMDLDSFYPYAYIGGNFRSEGLSTLMTYGAGGEFRFSEMGLGAAIKGFATVKDDEFTNSPTGRDSVTSRVNAGSKKFYSINPNSMATELFLNFAMTNDIKFKVYGGADIIGSNTSQGFHAGAMLTYALDFDGGKERVQRTKKRGGFKEDTDDGVDQNYFKPIDENKDDYVQPLDEQPSSQVDPATQNDLDELGYTIKLKKLKKKKKK